MKIEKKFSASGCVFHLLKFYLFPLEIMQRIKNEKKFHDNTVLDYLLRINYILYLLLLTMLILIYDFFYQRNEKFTLMLKMFIKTSQYKFKLKFLKYNSTGVIIKLIKKKQLIDYRNNAQIFMLVSFVRKPSFHEINLLFINSKLIKI